MGGGNIVVSLYQMGPRIPLFDYVGVSNCGSLVLWAPLAALAVSLTTTTFRRSWKKIVCF